MTFSIVSYVAGFIFLFVLQAPIYVQGLMFCYASNTFLVMLVTKWWKISVHTAGIAGPLVAMAYAFGLVVHSFFLVIIVIGVARVHLKRHTVIQVLSGVALGLLLTYLQFHIFFS